ncbi:MAG TPA: hypothetical protein VNO81_02630 [Candidatus Nitrosotenuis sp.]|nr:hypothetical protein [Candidatus Nitrosotenuis sp.]
MRFLRSLPVVLALLLSGTAAFADESESQELAQNLPVAVVAQVQGTVQLTRGDLEPRPLYWMDLLRPEDKIRVGPDGKVVALFFFDDHLEILDPDTEAKVEFKGLGKLSGSDIRRSAPQDRSRAVIEIPYLLLRKLKEVDFKLAEEPDAYQKEEVYLSAWVKNTTYPPVFYCKDLKLSKYRFQLFNEWNEFLYEHAATEPKFKFPYQAPFQLTKNGLYYWQVLGPDDSIVVRKYPFRMLTQLHARQVEAAEKRFEALQQKKKLTPVDYMDLFLLYNQLGILDKQIHIVREMIKLDPENPVLYRALTRLYVSRGCPAHALEAREKEIQLGFSDVIEK